MYKGARLGWAVPAYVPKDRLNSFEDLKKKTVADKLDRRIQGISAGAGEMALSKQANKTSYDVAAKRFIGAHPRLIKSWLGSAG